MASCASERPWKAHAKKVNVTSMVNTFFAPVGFENSYPLDSSLYHKMLDNGSSEYCAMVNAFTMSDVKLERHLPNRCHSQNFYFENCSVFLVGDTINIVFKTQNLRRSIASNKIMKVKLLENAHHTEIIHWGSEKQEIIHQDGSVVIQNSPESKVLKSSLKLNQGYYELGDTIVGEIKVVSVQYKGKRRIKVKEEASGKFRAIVGGFDIDCEISESLATSWLK